MSLPRSLLVSAAFYLTVSFATACGSGGAPKPAEVAKPAATVAAPATAATPQQTLERQYASVLDACTTEGDSAAECKEYVHNCIAVQEKPPSCLENHVGRVKERAKEEEHREEHVEREVETAHSENERTRANERERRLVREQEETAARLCSNSPEQCERARAEASQRIKEIEAEEK